jgi:hypothetical protein
LKLLPRLAPGVRPAAVAWNAAALLGFSALGAALVHLLAYHVVAVAPGPHWSATALALLLHCPLIGPLGLVVAVALLAPALAFREALRLERLNAALSNLIAAYRASLPPAHEALPRSPRRLAALFLLVLAAQGAWSVVAGLICPMSVIMVMGGARMTMSAATTWPLTPLHLLAALLIAAALWRYERRLRRLRAQVERRLLLLRALGVADPDPLPQPRAARLPAGCAGLTLFARPPPLTASRI